MVKCKCCGKILSKTFLKFSDYRRYPHMRVMDKNKKNYDNETIGISVLVFCNETCKKQYEDSLITEQYNGSPIYKLDEDIYVLYLEAPYSFKTIEDAKKEIDNRRKGIITMPTDLFLLNWQMTNG